MVKDGDNMVEKPYPQVGQIWHSQFHDAFCILLSTGKYVDDGTTIWYAQIKWTDTQEKDELSFDHLLGNDEDDYEHFTFIT